MKPTKGIVAEFPEIEREFVNRYEAYKKKKSVRNLAGLAIYWGKWSTYKNVFELESKLSEQETTEIYFTITEHHKDLLIY